MKSPSGTLFESLNLSHVRGAVIAVLLVMSSPLVIIMNPASAVAAPLALLTHENEIIETSSYHAELPGSKESNTGGTPTTQAALQIPRTLQSNDLVNSLAFYEVTFITSTTGPIDKIRMDFPAGTGVGAAGVIERVGIGGGTLLKSGSSITYDVTSPVSIPAGTFIRLEMFGIKNPINPSTAFTADITTRDSGGNLIDGPSQTNVYKIKKIVSSDIADGAIMSTKPAESFMKRVTLLDNPAGNSAGWNPDGGATTFEIDELALIGINESLVSISLRGAGGIALPVCGVFDYGIGIFAVVCTTAPSNGAELHYVVENLPAHVVQ